MNRNKLVITCLTVAVVLVGAGVYACDRKPPASKPDPAFSNVWSADTGIDLFSRGAELIRAAHESAWIVDNAGSEYAYTGYRESLAPPDNDNMMKYSFTERRTYEGAESTLQSTKETRYGHITAYSADNKKVTATVCRYVIPEVGVGGHQNNLDKFKSNMSVVDIHLENTVDDPGKPGIADRDPDHNDPTGHRIPNWNVFGTWKITKINRNMDFDPEGCWNWFQQRVPELREVPGSKTLRVPDDMQIPPQPVAVQYPEWIGPST